MIIIFYVCKSLKENPVESSSVCRCCKRSQTLFENINFQKPHVPNFAHWKILPAFPQKIDTVCGFVLSHVAMFARFIPNYYRFPEQLFSSTSGQIMKFKVSHDWHYCKNGHFPWGIWILSLTKCRMTDFDNIKETSILVGHPEPLPYITSDFLRCQSEIP